jgi:hypothetical protein
MLSRLFPPIRGKQTSSSKRACTCKSMANGKNPPNPYPNPELKHPLKSPSLHLNCSAPAAALSFSNKSYFVCQPCCPMSQSAASWANSLARGGKNSWYRASTFLAIAQRTPLLDQGQYDWVSNQQEFP